MLFCMPNTEFRLPFPVNRASSLSPQNPHSTCAIPRSPVDPFTDTDGLARREHRKEVGACHVFDPPAMMMSKMMFVKGAQQMAWNPGTSEGCQSCAVFMAANKTWKNDNDATSPAESLVICCAAAFLSSWRRLQETPMTWPKRGRSLELPALDICLGRPVQGGGASLVRKPMLRARSPSRRPSVPQHQLPRTPLSLAALTPRRAARRFEVTARACKRRIRFTNSHHGAARPWPSSWQRRHSRHRARLP